MTEIQTYYEDDLEEDLTLKLETERLELIPLLPHQLKFWVEDIASLERELKCIYRGEPLEGLFLEIVKGQLEITERHPDDYLWHSFWLLIRKTDRVVVGSADFKDVPDSKQEVEIGYGLGKEFEQNGYMTEAVRALCEWAFEQKNVAHIIAETDKDGISSQRILQRCGFAEEKRGETIWWRL
jgi:ribosomal-protein-alanine N-acetyltransferase